MSPLNRLALSSLGTAAAIGAVLGFIFGGFTGEHALFGSLLAFAFVAGGLIGAGKEEDPGYDFTCLPRAGLCLALCASIAFPGTGQALMSVIGIAFLGVAVCSIATGTSGI